MSRALTFATVVSFVLALASFAAALSLVGGPFPIDEAWRLGRGA